MNDGWNTLDMSVVHGVLTAEQCIAVTSALACVEVAPRSERINVCEQAIAAEIDDDRRTDRAKQARVLKALRNRLADLRVLARLEAVYMDSDDAPYEGAVNCTQSAREHAALVRAVRAADAAEET